jgi:hypothetical protein
MEQRKKTEKGRLTMISQWLNRLPVSAVSIFFGACIAFGIVAGCERKERVLDIETPGADVEVDRNLDTGEVEVNVNDKD